MSSLGRIYSAASQRPMAAAAIAAVLAGTCLALAPQARAAGVPVTLPVGEDKPDTEFTLTGPADVAQFKIKAAAGTDLFVGVYTYDSLKLKLFDPNGKFLKDYNVSGDTTNTAEEGLELHATSGGTYTAQVVGYAPFGSVNYPTDARIWAYPDCRGGPATKCSITPGKTKAATFAGANDDDAYLIKAPAGRSYAATLKIQSPDDVLYYTDFNLVNGRGEVVQTQLTGAGAARRNKATLKFKLSASGGPFYLQAKPRPPSAYDNRAKFTLSLAQQ